MLNELRKVELLLCLLLCLGGSAAAQMFYAASEPTQQLDLVNFTTGTVTDIFDVGNRPDSLVVNTQGQILYTVSSAGTLQMFDPKTGTNSVLWNFGQASPRDMLFEPGGASVLISLYATAQLARYNLTTGAITIFPQKIQHLGSSLDGLAYDPAGNLYAVVSHNTVCQLDPNTGAILQTLALEPHNAVNGGDGMVYDAFTKNLWVSHDGTLGNGLIEIPLTQSTPPVLGTPILLQTGNLHVPDGIISDGKGSLYIGEGLQFLTQYDIASDTIVRRVLVPGIDSAAFAPVNFTAALSPASATVLDGDTVAYTLNVTTADGSSPALQVTCNGLPSPGICNAPATVGVGQTPVQVESQSLAVGSYNFTVSVTDGIVIQKSSGQLTVGDFGAALGSNTLTVPVGQSGTVGASITGTNGFSDTVSLSCTSPTGATCSFTPATVNASAAGTPATLTVSVAARPASNLRRAGIGSPLLGMLTMASGMFLILCTPGAFNKTGMRRRWLSIALLMMGVLCVASCGGSSGSSTGGTGGGPSQPTTFTVSVQATAHAVTKNIGNVTVTVP